MLSQLFKSARSILPFKRKVFTADPGTPATTSSKMVTTRGQSGSKAAESSPVVKSVPSESTPASLRKRRRGQTGVDLKNDDILDDTITTPSKKRQRKLPLRNKDEEHSESHSNFAVVIPVSDLPLEVTATKVSSQGKAKTKSPSSGKNSESSVLEIADSQEQDDESVGKKSNEEATAKQEKEHTKAPVTSTGGRNTSKRGKKSVSSPKTSELKSSKAVNGSTPLTSKHKRFGSEEPVIEEALEATRTEVDPSEDDDEDSDDDAPEVVETHDAQEKARTAARSAAKAAEE